MPRMPTTTTRALVSELGPHRYRPRVPHCLACLYRLLDQDLVEFVTPARLPVTAWGPIVWHASESCATSVYVVQYLAAMGRQSPGLASF